MLGGYDKLNFATIANDLNTTRANIHYHFKNKESLAVEVTRQYAERHSEEFKALCLSFNGDFIGLFTAIDDAFWFDDNLSVMCNILAADPEIPKMILTLTQKLYQDIECLIIDAIQHGVDSKQIRDDVDVVREAARVHVLMMGIISAAQHSPDLGQAKQQLSGLLVDWANSLS
ncbi:transcriptional regulator, TetR family [Shewanella psychrophila]|uniref:Transcriptional regulator, TetR family n=2 Tax=Shewanella psychrophila TaxID=225848 RepID=A0A1S6HVP3_9GAMM|nr:transcriptional regulator, TetR family [Shewanella psychrophila]